MPTQKITMSAVITTLASSLAKVVVFQWCPRTELPRSQDGKINDDYLKQIVDALGFPKAK
jgi:hypothetical protein